MVYFHWIYLLLYVAIMIPAIIRVLLDNTAGKEDLVFIALIVNK